MLPHKQSEASKPTDLAHNNYKMKCEKVYMSIHKTIKYSDLIETLEVNKTLKMYCKVATFRRLIKITSDNM